jgi:hypothetical protein
MGDSDKGLFSDGLVNAADLEADLSGSDSGDPEFRLAFAFAHSGFKRLGAYRLMWKYPDIDFAFTMQKMSSRDAAGLNVLSGNPTGFERLQAVLAKSHIITSRGVAFHFASLALAILDSFRHHRHFSFPSQNQIHQGGFPGQNANLSLFQPCQAGRHQDAASRGPVQLWGPSCFAFPSLPVRICRFRCRPASRRAWADGDAVEPVVQFLHRICLCRSRP